MERVTGIGGIFIRARDPERLRAWYAEHGRPWVYARESRDVAVTGEAVAIEGARFSSGKLRRTFVEAEASGVFVAAVPNIDGPTSTATCARHHVGCREARYAPQPGRRLARRSSSRSHVQNSRHEGLLRGPRCTRDPQHVLADPFPSPGIGAPVRQASVSTQLVQLPHRELAVLTACQRGNLTIDLHGRQ